MILFFEWMSFAIPNMYIFSEAINSLANDDMTFHLEAMLLNCIYYY